MTISASLRRWVIQRAGVQVTGLRATGRATVQALDLNRPTLLAIRAEEELLVCHPLP